MEFIGTKAQHELLRAIARHCGIVGEWGGWLRRNGKPVCQGWAAFWQVCRSRGWIVQHSGGTWLRRGVVCDGWRIDWRAVR